MKKYAIFLLFLSGCAAPGPWTSIQMQPTQKETRLEVERFVTPGMSVERASDILSKQGFVRLGARNAPFLTFDKCYEKTGNFISGQDRGVEIRIYHQDGTITGIDVDNYSRPSGDVRK